MSKVPVTLKVGQTEKGLITRCSVTVSRVGSAARAGAADPRTEATTAMKRMRILASLEFDLAARKPRWKLKTRGKQTGNGGVTCSPENVTLEFRLLGPVEAEADSTPLNLGGPQQRAVLALLLLRSIQVVHRDRLIDELWGDRPPVAARETIKVYVGRLRRIFGENGSGATLATRGGGYVLEVDAEQVDLHRFEQLRAQGSAALETGDASTAATLLRDALSLWRGPPLGGLGDVAFAYSEQERLEEARLVALEERIEAELA